MNLKNTREVYYYKDYYLKFFSKLNKAAKEKCNWTIQLVSTLERVPSKYFKYITGSSGLYEIRVEYNSDIYRIFCFFDQGNLIILLNAFQKKTEKTPHKEITLAEKLKSEYYLEK